MEKRLRSSGASLLALRILIILASAAAFMPFLNPARLSGLIAKNVSLFTCAVSYNTIGNNFIRAITNGWVSQTSISMMYIGALVTGLGTAGLIAAVCLSLGNLKMRRLSAQVSLAAAAVGLAGTAALCVAYTMLSGSAQAVRVDPLMPMGVTVYFALFGLVLLLSAFTWRSLPQAAAGDRYEMAAKYRLFLMILPFLVLVALFAYLPLWGLRFAFVDYRAGIEATWNDFVGLKWFRYLLSNAATRADIIRVLKNTFAMSGLGLLTSWMPMVFAVFLSEIKSGKGRRAVQTLTTIPNFISWVLVYSVAFAIFSTEGFLNWALSNLGLIESGTNFLLSGENIWIKMWAWGTWKGLGWGAIIYIAAISGIDQQLYEAATVDGAGRFAKMWHITMPGLLPTYFVMLLLAIANILSNGLDQYLAFYNPANRSSIQVLDLYVYQMGMASSSSSGVPLATVIGMLKSVISVTLLFSANKISKWLRGESIV